MNTILIAAIVIIVLGALIAAYNNGVRLRNYVNSTQFQNVEELKKMLLLHIDKCDFQFTEHEHAIKDIIHALNNLIDSPKQNRKIGFVKDN